MFDGVEAVAFDLWETLITNPVGASQRQDARRVAALTAVLMEADVPHDSERMEHAYRELWHRCHELYWSRDLDIPTRRQIEHLLEALSVTPEGLHESVLIDLEHAYAATLLDHPPVAVDDAREVLDHLKRSGRRIGLISNTGRTPGRILRDVLDRLGLARSIDAMRFSDEERLCKPQEPIFRALLSDLGRAPAVTLFVGDNLDVDVYGAQRCGMRAVHFTPEQRGTAVAPAVERGEAIHADATIRRLSELLPLLERSGI